ncbi:hypothetical protein TIFTF001_044339 [Ficus carica]|uniref:Uncharacterized protein n=1 Tax=Ficus carica TaxID=3494 RepID=A0AA87Z3Z2_FICCA|nr:hypothetical protein TIFTF001_044339 [Ficus carica]
MLRTLTEEINKVWKEARAHYAGQIDMNENKFVKVLVLDGCFIIELFRKQAYEKDLKDKNDPIFSMSCLFQFLLNDLILLENQIPWMVLDKLFNLTRTSVDNKYLVQLAIDFFGNIFSTTPPPIQPLLSPSHPSKHILDLLRNSLVLNSSMLENRDNQEMVSSEPDPMHSASTLKDSGVKPIHSATSLGDSGIKRTQLATTLEDSGIKRMHSATSLVESGIKFEMRESKSILDIEFKEGVLKIPQLFIQETTETVFRNLISLEQCCPNYEPTFTSYAVLLDNLINSREDMEVLCKSKAIESWLNIDDATKFFNKLYIDTFVKKSYYSNLTFKVDKYCERFWPRQRRVLMRDYFRHPWAQISVAAASVGLILAFLQTLFTIIK